MKNNINVGDIIYWGEGAGKIIGFVMDINEEQDTITIHWFEYPEHPEVYGLQAIKEFRRIEWK